MERFERLEGSGRQKTSMNERQRHDRYRELFGNPSAFHATVVHLRRHAVTLSLAFTVAFVAYAGNVYAGWRAQPLVDGTFAAPSLGYPVLIRRDGRGVPHIQAGNERDLFFAQGFAEGSDRLFQLELTRRYAFGELAEVFGPKALSLDEEQRFYDARHVAAQQLRALSVADRSDLEAFSRGVNAAIRAQPLPVEFRVLLLRPRPWTPSDSLAISYAVSIALADSWREVLARNDVWQRVGPKRFDDYVPLTDPKYDVSLSGALAPHDGVPQNRALERTLSLNISRPRRAGSDAWAAGADRTLARRALLANDPHLDLTIPGIWYLLDLKAPGFHAAGAAIPGVPGILLGHNASIAWGATNSDASSITVFASEKLRRVNWQREIFHVRFGKDVAKQYYRTGREFGVPCACNSQRLVLVRLPPNYQDRPAIATFLRLDRARSVREAMTVLSTYAGTPENFVIADTTGSAAYHLAGTIARDPAWGRFVHSARDARTMYAVIPFPQLPSVPPSRDALIVSANNKMYGPGYPYRLAAEFDAPYRAYRIAQMLHARRAYDASYFTRMQLDTVSPIDLEFSRAIASYARERLRREPAAVREALEHWNGVFSADSRAATIEHAVRSDLEEGARSLFALMQEVRRRGPSAYLDDTLPGALFAAAQTTRRQWGEAGAIPVEHPLAPLWLRFLNGTTLPGDGDEYTIHLQETGFAQSFRAVWDVGNWDAGGISLPSGESGEPGSGHYTDLTAAWIKGDLEPLPFSERAVAAATHSSLTLMPAR